MSTIPIQNLVIDNSADIGLSSDLINGIYKTSSLTDLSQNVYTKIFDLSSNLNTAISTKENILSFNGPMSKSSNTVSIDLSQYPLKTYVDGSLNTINTTLGTKQNNFTCITPLIKNDVSNNISIDLSAYALKNALNASNVTSGTLSVSRGGIGTTTLNNNQILLGNATSNIKSTNVFIYDISNNRLGVNTNVPSDTLHVTGKIRCNDGEIVQGINFGSDTEYYEFMKFTSSAHSMRTVSLGSDIGGNKFGFFTVGGGAPDPDPHLILDRTGGGIRTNIYGFLGIGTTNPVHPLDVSGNIRGSGFIGSGSSLTNLDYNNISSNKPIFISPLIQDVSNNITIDLSAYPLKTNVDSSLNNLQTTKQDNLLFTSPLLKDISNNVTIDLSAYPLKTYVDSSLNSLNTNKQNNFTCITPLIKNDVSNNISIDLSAYTTTGNDPNYLLKAGGTMTGNLIVNPAIPNIQLGGTNGHNLGVATAAGHFSASAIAGDMILRSRNKLILQSGTTAAFIIDASNNVVIGTTTNALYKLSVDGAFNSTSLYNNGTLINFNAYATNTNLTTNYYNKTSTDSLLNTKQDTLLFTSPLLKDISNNVTIDLSAYPLKTYVDSSLNTIDTTLGTKENILTFSAPLTRTTNTIGIDLSSYSTTGNDTNYLLKTGGTMTGDLNITTATKVLNFGSRTEDYLIRLFGTDYGFGINGGVLRYNSGANHVFYCAGTERMRLTTDGNLSTTGYIYAGGTTNGLRINGNDYGNTIYQAATTIGGQPANIGFTLRDANSFNFQSFSTAGAYTTIASLNTTNGLSLFGNIIYNYLFNNTGVSHEDTITDFNNVSKFGYQFVRGNTNGPGTVSTFNQYYQWFIGLGANYGVNSHGCQFALPRYTGQPELSVRFKENNVWTDWFGINSVGVRMPINTWGIGSKDGKNRMGNLNNGATLFRGYGTPTLADNAFEFRNTADSLILNISDSGNASLAGRFSARFLTISNTNRDLLGINFENTQVGNENNATIYCIQGTFTGFHRCFTEDELFDKNNPQLFKDNYEGRIVISTGKIATDTNDNNEEWIIKYDKDGITIEDALPQIELSRKKKDKRVFGVLGDKRRNNSRPERLIINSVGEGALWVINSNGNIENGDYITSSDYMGYGEKQDDDLLHNYTVAKSTMDCNFELDSNLYNCLELENGMRIAFIAVTYHCG